MPEYHVTMTVTWVQSLEADDKEDAIEICKDIMQEEHSITIDDSEIVEVEEQ